MTAIRQNQYSQPPQAIETLPPIQAGVGVQGTIQLPQGVTITGVRATSHGATAFTQPGFEYNSGFSIDQNGKFNFNPEADPYRAAGRYTLRFSNGEEISLFVSPPPPQIDKPKPVQGDAFVPVNGNQDLSDEWDVDVDILTGVSKPLPKNLKEIKDRLASLSEHQRNERRNILEQRFNQNRNKGQGLSLDEFLEYLLLNNASPDLVRSIARYYDKKPFDAPAIGGNLPAPVGVLNIPLLNLNNIPIGNGDNTPKKTMPRILQELILLNLDSHSDEITVLQQQINIGRTLHPRDWIKYFILRGNNIEAAEQCAIEFTVLNNPNNPNNPIIPAVIDNVNEPPGTILTQAECWRRFHLPEQRHLARLYIRSYIQGEQLTVDERTILNAGLTTYNTNYKTIQARIRADRARNQQIEAQFAPVRNAMNNGQFLTDAQLKIYADYESIHDTDYEKEIKRLIKKHLQHIQDPNSQVLTHMEQATFTTWRLFSGSNHLLVRRLMTVSPTANSWDPGLTSPFRDFIRPIPPNTRLTTHQEGELLRTMEGVVNRIGRLTLNPPNPQAPPNPELAFLNQTLRWYKIAFVENHRRVYGRVREAWHLVRDDRRRPDDSTLQEIEQLCGVQLRGKNLDELETSLRSAMERLHRQYQRGMDSLITDPTQRRREQLTTGLGVDMAEFILDRYPVQLDLVISPVNRQAQQLQERLEELERQRRNGISISPQTINRLMADFQALQQRVPQSIDQINGSPTEIADIERFRASIGTTLQSYFSNFRNDGYGLYLLPPNNPVNPEQQNLRNLFNSLKNNPSIGEEKAVRILAVIRTLKNLPPEILNRLTGQTSINIDTTIQAILANNRSNQAASFILDRVGHFNFGLNPNWAEDTSSLIQHRMTQEENNTNTSITGNTLIEAITIPGISLGYSFAARRLVVAPRFNALRNSVSVDAIRNNLSLVIGQVGSTLQPVGTEIAPLVRRVHSEVCGNNEEKTKRLFAIIKFLESRPAFLKETFGMDKFDIKETLTNLLDINHTSSLKTFLKEVMCAPNWNLVQERVNYVSNRMIQEARRRSPNYAPGVHPYGEQNHPPTVNGQVNINLIRQNDGGLTNNTITQLNQLSSNINLLRSRANNLRATSFAQILYSHGFRDIPNSGINIGFGIEVGGITVQSIAQQVTSQYSEEELRKLYANIETYNTLPPELKRLINPAYVDNSDNIKRLENESNSITNELNTLAADIRRKTRNTIEILGTEITIPDRALQVISGKIIEILGTEITVPDRALQVISGKTIEILGTEITVPDRALQVISGLSEAERGTLYANIRRYNDLQLKSQELKDQAQQLRDQNNISSINITGQLVNGTFNNNSSHNFLLGNNLTQKLQELLRERRDNENELNQTLKRLGQRSNNTLTNLERGIANRERIVDIFNDSYWRQHDQNRALQGLNFYSNKIKELQTQLGESQRQSLSIEIAFHTQRIIELRLKGDTIEANVKLRELLNRHGMHLSYLSPTIWGMIIGPGGLIESQGRQGLQRRELELTRNLFNEDSNTRFTNTLAFLQPTTNHRPTHSVAYSCAIRNITDGNPTLLTTSHAVGRINNIAMTINGLVQANLKGGRYTSTEVVNFVRAQAEEMERLRSELHKNGHVTKLTQQLEDLKKLEEQIKQTTGNTELKRDIRKSIETYEGILKVLNNDGIKKFCDFVKDPAKFNSHSWADWFRNDGLKMLGGLICSIGAMAVTIATCGGGAPLLVAALAGTVGGIVGSDLGGYVNHQIQHSYNNNYNGLPMIMRLGEQTYTPDRELGINGSTSTITLESLEDHYGERFYQDFCMAFVGGVVSQTSGAFARALVLGPAARSLSIRQSITRLASRIRTIESGTRGTPLHGQAMSFLNILRAETISQLGTMARVEPLRAGLEELFGHQAGHLALIIDCTIMGTRHGIRQGHAESISGFAGGAIRLNETNRAMPFTYDTSTPALRTALERFLNTARERGCFVQRTGERIIIWQAGNAPLILHPHSSIQAHTPQVNGNSHVTPPFQNHQNTPSREFYANLERSVYQEVARANQNGHDISRRTVREIFEGVPGERLSHSEIETRANQVLNEYFKDIPVAARPKIEFVDLPGSTYGSYNPTNHTIRLNRNIFNHLVKGNNQNPLAGILHQHFRDTIIHESRHAQSAMLLSRIPEAQVQNFLRQEAFNLLQQGNISQGEPGTPHGRINMPESCHNDLRALVEKHIGNNSSRNVLEQDVANFIKNHRAILERNFTNLDLASREVLMRRVLTNTLETQNVAFQAILQRRVPQANNLPPLNIENDAARIALRNNFRERIVVRENYMIMIDERANMRYFSTPEEYHARQEFTRIRRDRIINDLNTLREVGNPSPELKPIIEALGRELQACNTILEINVLNRRTQHLLDLLNRSSHGNNPNNFVANNLQRLQQLRLLELKLKGLPQLHEQVLETSVRNRTLREIQEFYSKNNITPEMQRQLASIPHENLPLEVRNSNAFQYANRDGRRVTFEIDPTLPANRPAHAEVRVNPNGTRETIIRVKDAGTLNNSRIIEHEIAHANRRTGIIDPVRQNGTKMSEPEYLARRALEEFNVRARRNPGEAPHGPNAEHSRRIQELIRQNKLKEAIEYAEANGLRNYMQGFKADYQYNVNRNPRTQALVQIGNHNPLGEAINNAISNIDKLPLNMPQEIKNTLRRRLESIRELQGLSQEHEGLLNIVLNDLQTPGALNLNSVSRIQTDLANLHRTIIAERFLQNVPVQLGLHMDPQFQQRLNRFLAEVDNHLPVTSPLSSDRGLHIAQEFLSEFNSLIRHPNMTQQARADLLQALQGNGHKGGFIGKPGASSKDLQGLTYELKAARLLIEEGYTIERLGLKLKDTIIDGINRGAGEIDIVAIAPNGTKHYIETKNTNAAMIEKISKKPDQLIRLIHTAQTNNGKAFLSIGGDSIEIQVASNNNPPSLTGNILTVPKNYNTNPEFHKRLITIFEKRGN